MSGKRLKLQKEQEFKVLDALATSDKPLSPYMISKKTRIARSSIFNVVNRLKAKAWIKEYEREIWRIKELEAKRYILSEVGFIHYLVALFPKAEKYSADFKVVKYDRYENVKDLTSRAMINYSKFFSYPLFVEWDEIERVFGKEESVNALLHACLETWLSREFYPIVRYPFEAVLEVAKSKIVHKLTLEFFRYLRLFGAIKPKKLTKTVKEIAKGVILKEIEKLKREERELINLASVLGID